MSVIGNVRKMIKIDGIGLTKMLPTKYKNSTYEWKGDFRTIRNELYSFGKYQITADTILITELPLRVWTDDYIDDMTKKMTTDERIIESIHPGKSDDLKVAIEVVLKPGAIDILEHAGDSVFTDGIEEYFNLKELMDDHLNFYGVHSEVLMLERYEDVMSIWFAERKRFYALRIERKRKILELKIIAKNNIIRYVQNVQSYDFPGKVESVMVQKLSDEKYDKIASGKLANPKFIKNDQLEEKILRGDKSSYDYLLGLSDLKKSKEAMAKYLSELDELNNELIELDIMAGKGLFPGAILFESELDALEKVIETGQKTFWKYESHNKFKFA
jgi:DNA gyrase/topoisomerase IV subunit A